MFSNIVVLFRSIFTTYFVALVLFCSFFLSYVYPHIMIDSNADFKKEYRIGQLIGYIYTGGALIGFAIAKLFG